MYQAPSKVTVTARISFLPCRRTRQPMDHHLHSRVEGILAGTAEVEGGCIRSTAAGSSGKESLIPVVEVLDEVRDIFPALHKVLRQRRR